MPQEVVTVDAQQIAELEQLIRNYPANAEAVINQYLHQTAGEMIRAEIMRSIPASGRKWKKKLPPASAANPFGQKDDNLAVTIGTGKSSGGNGKYDYLYFPDDGSNTKRHRGEQHFMQGGADRVLPRMIDDMTAALSQNLSEE